MCKSASIGSVGNECANNDEIDLLIGGDYYWSFVSGDSIRLNEKLVVLNSKFGYILSGPVRRYNSKYR